MTQRTTTIYTCEGCVDEVEGELYVIAPYGWRKLTWQGGYTGDESREAHFCPRCVPARLKGIDILLEAKGSGPL